MEKITTHNYEAYYLDYLEGNLQKAELLAFKKFLKENPHLELAEVDLVSIDSKPEKKELLKKELKREETTGLLQTDYLLIASLEKQLTEEDQIKLDALIKEKPQLLDSLNFYSKTIISEESLKAFPTKSSLYKRSPKVILLYRSMSAAAAILVLFMVSLNFLKTESYQPIANHFRTEQAKNLQGFTDKLINKQVESEILQSKLVIESSPIQAEEGSITKAGFKSIEKKEIIQLAAKPKKGIKPIDEQQAEPIEAAEVLLAAKQATNVKESNELEETLSDSLKTAQVASIELNKDEVRISKNEAANLTAFAKEAIQKEVLKNKSLKEILLEELNELTNNKVKVSGRNEEVFALNIGNFSFSRKK